MIEVELLGAGIVSGEHGPRSSPGAELPSLEEVRRLCMLAAASAGVRDGHIAVEFVDARRIAQLNAEYSNEPPPTPPRHPESPNGPPPPDVLSFPLDGGEPVDGVVPAAAVRELGDVMICPEHTADVREAIVHGVLHLLGMDHETDDGEMLALQRELLARAGP